MIITPSPVQPSELNCTELTEVVSDVRGGGPGGLRPRDASSGAHWRQGPILMKLDVSFVIQVPSETQKLHNYSNI